MRETLTHFYSGLKLNEESVAFHGELVSSFYETLSFIILKRIQPLAAVENNDDDLEFALN
jgi:hypothetical protein